MKMSVLVEEGVRRIRNCSRRMGDEDWEVRRKILEEWSMKMKRSGYPATTRHQVVKASVERWKKMCQWAGGGGRPINQKMAKGLTKDGKGDENCVLAQGK